MKIIGQGNFIFLLGFMGCGKSTVGRELADRLMDWNFIDLDAYIESAERKTISTIFDTNGEEYFRKLESKYLKILLKNKEKPAVIALGGGTPCYHSNMDIVAGHPSFYLKLGIDRLVDRLASDADHRPLLQGLNKSQLKRFIKAKLQDRNPYYNLAKYTLMAHAEPARLATRIIHRLTS